MYHIQFILYVVLLYIPYAHIPKHQKLISASVTSPIHILRQRTQSVITIRSGLVDATEAFQEPSPPRITPTIDTLYPWIIINAHLSIILILWIAELDRVGPARLLRLPTVVVVFFFFVTPWLPFVIWTHSAIRKGRGHVTPIQATIGRRSCRHKGAHTKQVHYKHIEAVVLGAGRRNVCVIVCVIVIVCVCVCVKM